MLEAEFVTRRGWVTREHFLDLVGATNLIPGPNSTEMVMHLGYERAGWLGLGVAGLAFLIPAVLLTAALAAFYQAFGALPQLQPVLEGIKPVVLVVIALALRKLLGSARRHAGRAVVGLVVLAASLWGLPEVPLLLGAGLWGLLGFGWLRRGGATLGSWLALCWSSGAQLSSAAPLAASAPSAGGIGLASLFWVFLKIGSVLYGSGYVLFAFLEGELVRERAWLTQPQLLDAIAIGQFTPGPVLSSATFVGYLVAGWPGAVVATVGIFLPSFFFVLLLQRLLPKMRASKALSAFLDAVNTAALALMASVLGKMGAQVMVTPQSWAIAGLALWALSGGWVSVPGMVVVGGLLGGLGHALSDSLLRGF